ncbi:hypothetical protein SAMN05421640_2829 [Ekhidna lutea]|uniref:Uncharacterized protein n=2 Tax=Ekhidna lutea TaxID=447679 RepID=A0A239KQ12_EKHLU|nr:hypothetical protein SAMN05421640_2829 [Ekhidna lutea]
MVMSIYGVDELHGLHLFDLAKKKLSETNALLYMPEQEYSLLEKGVPKETIYSNQISDSLKTIIALRSKSRYILKVEVLDSSGGSLFGSYTANELNRYNSPFNQANERNTAVIAFTVYDTDRNITENKFHVKTQINPLTIDEDGGESRINFTSENTAISKAFMKGIKQLKKGVINN